MLDRIVGGAINYGENKLQGEAVEEKTTFKGGLLRFFVTLVWVIITLAVSLGAFLAMFGQAFNMLFETGDNSWGVLAVAACLIIAIVTFCVPYLRKKGTTTRWCGIVCLGDAIWWMYIMFTGF